MGPRTEKRSDAGLFESDSSGVSCRRIIQSSTGPSKASQVPPLATNRIKLTENQNSNFKYDDR